MRDNHGFTPSRRAYQTNFRRWQFPSKHNPLHRDADLVDRVKELWEQNLTHRAMVQKLTDEGYDLKSRELMRLRTKHRLLLRHANGVKPADDLEAQLLSAVQNDPEELERRRNERRSEMQADSDARYATKKRRRRTRPFGGLAPDPIGPPRFPSETTLDESKIILSLDAAAYQHVRDRFQAICEANGVLKKTQAGPEKWQALKNQLVSEDEHLQNVFLAGENEEQKALALDVIGLDVTKRMRTMDRALTIADAKNILGLNPEQNRRMRDSLYAVLKADGFISITEAGERYNRLKQGWIDSTPYLVDLLSEEHPNHEQRRRAFEFICRDVVKRVRDDNKNPAKAGYMPPTLPMNDAAASAAAGLQALQANTAALKDQAPRLPPTRVAHREPRSTVTNAQIDPSLFPAANGGTYTPVDQAPTPFAAYFKPHPDSQVHKTAKMWLGQLNTPTVHDLRSTMSTKWADAIFERIQGLSKDVNGQQLTYEIDEDEELEAYLDHVAGGKTVFQVLMRHV